MNRLEVVNMQGIRLQYFTAGIVNRGLALLIDLFILMLSILLFFWALQGYYSSEDLFILTIALPIFFFYTLLFELLNNGKSIGKQIVGLKVIRVDGKPVSGYDYLIRWMFRCIDIYMCFGTLAAVMVGATPRAQRLGDLLADTTVIRTKQMRVPLKRILSLNELAKHKPKHPDVADFTEGQVLIIKEALSRQKKFNNTHHRELVNDLAERVAQRLELKETPKNATLFLQEIITDYISLTR